MASNDGQERGIARCLKRTQYAVLSLADEEVLTMVELCSTLTCPDSGHVETETMPTAACQFFHECSVCRTILRANEGDCCVFCSFRDVKGPSQQGTLAA